MSVIEIIAQVGAGHNCLETNAAQSLFRRGVAELHSSLDGASWLPLKLQSGRRGAEAERGVRCAHRSHPLALKRWWLHRSTCRNELWPYCAWWQSSVRLDKEDAPAYRAFSPSWWNDTGRTLRRRGCPSAKRNPSCPPHYTERANSSSR